jgi:tRNA pseudouridine38-40 synthase
MEADEHRIRLTLHYDGGAFAGWQVQPGARTVQGDLEAALLRLTGRSTRVTGAGRTDAGVHATGQVAGVVVPERWDAVELRRALNAVLPRDLWVAAAAAADPTFHARHGAVARGYVYRLGIADTARSPFVRRWCWPLAQPVPLDRLNDAAARFRGDHSFLSFAKTGQPHRGDRSIVYVAQWKGTATTATFHVVAKRFLHHMVRYMVGTMVEAALGRRPLEDIDALLRNEPGIVTSRPAPAAGLYLTRVYYDTAELAETNDDWSDGDAADEILS